MLQKDEKLSLLAYLSKAQNIIYGEPDEVNSTDITLVELIYIIQRDEKVLHKDLDLFIKYKKTIYNLFNEMENLIKKSIYFK